MNDINQGKNRFSWIIGFFMAPFPTSLYAVSKAGEKWASFAIAMFASLYGYCAIPDVTSDFYSYSNSLTDFSWRYSAETATDIYVYIITGVVSHFTQNGHILMAVFGFLYGLLVANGLRLFSELGYCNKYLQLFFLFLFVNIFNLSVLGGVRYATAGILLFFGINYYILSKKNIYLIFIALTPLVHFSYIIFVAIFILYHFFLHNKPIIVFVLFIVSHIINLFGMGENIANFMPFFGENIAEKGEAYLNMDLDEVINTYQGAFWNRIGICFRISIRAVALTMFYCYYRKLREQVYDSSAFQLFLFALTFSSFANIFEPIPHLGLRIQRTSSAYYLLPIYCLFRDYGEMDNLITKIAKYLFIISGSFSILIAIRRITNFVPISMVFFPLPFAGLSDITMSVILGLE